LNIYLDIEFRNKNKSNTPAFQHSELFNVLPRSGLMVFSERRSKATIRVPAISLFQEIWRMPAFSATWIPN